MKLCYLSFIFLLIAYSNVFAQKDERAKQILAQVSSKYKTYDVIKTGFIYTIESPQAKSKETQSGTLLSKTRTNKFKVTLYDGSNLKTSSIVQELISDGKQQWTYLKKDNEVQINNASPADEALNPAHVFTMYEKGFKYVYTGEQKVGVTTYQVIDMTPTDTKKSFFKVRLMINKVKSQIYSAMVFDKNGNKYTYTLQSFLSSFKTTDDAFTFNVKAHPGVEVVDLR